MSERRSIPDLECEIRELKGFQESSREEIAKYKAVLRAVWNEHQPLVLHPLGEIGFELRCCRCRTDEHHTRGNDNFVPWPCPTVAPFVKYAQYLPAQDDGESNSSSPQADTAPCGEAASPAPAGETAVAGDASKLPASNAGGESE